MYSTESIKSKQGQELESIYLKFAPMIPCNLISSACLMALLSIIIGIAPVRAQSKFSGILTDAVKAPLEGALLQWKSRSAHSITDSAGRFEIIKSKYDTILVIQYVGFKILEYRVDSNVAVGNIILSENTDLQQIEVKAKRSDVYTPLTRNTNMEVMTSRELRKAPCCNLSESFETSAVIDANYTNAALGTREIEMLGLRGIYSQIMIDSRPTMYNFAAPFAFDFIPGPWLKGIQVSKGTGTVVNGSEGLAGQINVDIIDPQNGPKLFVNGYMNQGSRFEANIINNRKFDEHFSLGTLLHGDQDDHHRDENNDGFLDAPRKKQLNGMQRFHYQSLKWEAQVNAHGIYDEREGGQYAHPNPEHRDDLIQYDQINKRIEIFGNIGFLGFTDEGKSIGFQWHAQRHEYEATYARLANGTDNSYYTNLIYQDKLKSKHHMIQAGLSMRRSITKEGFSDFIFNRNEFIPGAFTEYNYNADVKDTKFGFTAGWRVDKFDQYGVKSTPRLSMRYQVEDYGTIRASVGRAYRMPNIISDNIHFIGLGRYMRSNSIGLDIANNYGLSYIQKIFLGPTEWNISLDLYRTEFKQQNIQDIETSVQYITNTYLPNGSRINFGLIQNQFQLNKNFGFKLAYKFTDARYRLSAGAPLLTKLYLPKHRVLTTLDYTGDDNKWIGNVTVQWVGEQRLLDISSYPTPGSNGHPNQSPNYIMMNIHAGRAIGKWDLYAGVENATNYFQDYQIVSPTAAGSRFFDATRLYGPTMGLRWYVGTKFLIE